MPRRNSAGERIGNYKLRDHQVLEIRRRVLAGERNVILATEFGVSASTIARLASGERWADVASPRLEESRNSGERHFRAKASEALVRLIRQGYAQGKPYQELADTVGISVTAVFNIVKRKTWKHVD